MYNDKQLLRYRCLTEASALLESYQIDVLLEEANNAIGTKTFGDRVREAWEKMKVWFLKTFHNGDVAKQDCQTYDENQLVAVANKLQQNAQKLQNGQAPLDAEDELNLKKKNIKKGTFLGISKITKIFAASGVAMAITGKILKNKGRQLHRDAVHKENMAYKNEMKKLKANGLSPELIQSAENITKQSNFLMRAVKDMLNFFGKSSQNQPANNNNNMQQNQNSVQESSYMYNDKQLLRYRCLTEAASLLESYQIDVLLEEAQVAPKKTLGERVHAIWEKMKVWFLKTFHRNDVAKQDCETYDENDILMEVQYLQNDANMVKQGKEISEKELKIRKKQLRKDAKIGFGTILKAITGVGAALASVKFANKARQSFSDNLKNYNDEKKFNKNAEDIGRQNAINDYREKEMREKQKMAEKLQREKERYAKQQQRSNNNPGVNEINNRSSRIMGFIKKYLGCFGPAQPINASIKG